MAPRKTSTDAVEPRRSTRIAEKPKSPAEEVKPKPRAKGTGKKRGADVAKEPAEEEGRQVKKAKGSSVEDEEDQLANDDDDDDDAPQVVDVGDTIPDVTLKDEKDEDVNVAELVKDKGLVLFLVPKADTPGCTRQACGFRDAHADFEKHNVHVFCLSSDKPAAQAKWQAKHTLPYSLLSDPERVLIKALGAGEGGKTQRSHFIFEKGGKLVEKQLPVRAADSPQQALDFVGKMKT